MKKAAVIVFLFVFVFQMVGVFVLFKAQQIKIKQAVKTQIKQGVPRSDLTVLTFDVSKISHLKWIDDHEFIYNGNMYDVIETTVSDNKIEYLCLLDHQETELFKHLNKLVGNELCKDKTNQGSKTKVFVNWISMDNFYRETVVLNSCENIITKYQFRTAKWQPNPDFPPPRFIV